MLEECFCLASECVAYLEIVSDLFNPDRPENVSPSPLVGNDAEPIRRLATLYFEWYGLANGADPASVVHERPVEFDGLVTTSWHMATMRTAEQILERIQHSVCLNGDDWWKDDPHLSLEYFGSGLAELPRSCISRTVGAYPPDRIKWLRVALEQEYSRTVPNRLPGDAGPTTERQNNGATNGRGGRRRDPHISDLLALADAYKSENPDSTDQECVEKYNARYAAPIKEGKREKATLERLRNARYDRRHRSQ